MATTMKKGRTHKHQPHMFFDVLMFLEAVVLFWLEECRVVHAGIYDGLRKSALEVRVPIRKPHFSTVHAGIYLHYVCKVKWFLGLLRKNRMWGFSGGYTAQRFTNCMAQLLCRGFLCQRRKQGSETFSSTNQISL